MSYLSLQLSATVTNMKSLSDPDSQSLDQDSQLSDPDSPILDQVSQSLDPDSLTSDQDSQSLDDSSWTWFRSQYICQTLWISNSLNINLKYKLFELIILFSTLIRGVQQKLKIYFCWFWYAFEYLRNIREKLVKYFKSKIFYMTSFWSK